ncbi:MAG: fluoride efflux transporter CrcB [Myxococcota bacterium]
MRSLLVIALAGAFGTLSRYAVSGWSYRLFGPRFAYGTLIVNLVGCVLLGLVMQLGLSTDLVPPALRVPLGVGFLGAFTTFSTFSYETLRYIEDGALVLAGLNVAVSVVGGLGAVWLGFVLARLVVGGS